MGRAREHGYEVQRQPKIRPFVTSAVSGKETPTKTSGVGPDLKFPEASFATLTGWKVGSITWHESGLALLGVLATSARWCWLVYSPPAVLGPAAGYPTGHTSSHDR